MDHSSTLSMENILVEMSMDHQKLGFILPFNPIVGLREIVNDHKPLFVSNIFHKSFIEIDEKGTQACAETVASLDFISYRVQRGRIDFVAGHPFLFVIRENTTGIVQFMGQMLNPSLK
ncbi:Serine protease inhibitor (SERPIN) family protein [Heracleum sosnowskyi]|uniref:Serine protease inhibitor (SERPIN) family protein n=1 Tax=Heracleum sosnowskyi TaxID=360622 RepID=A0AAD8MQK3_9APIA|nr:Serine protease inhibitor (SERPIN) family protein [Heracleum sosnowskyi]